MPCPREGCHGEVTRGPFFSAGGSFHRCDTEGHKSRWCDTTQSWMPLDMARAGDCCDDCPVLMAPVVHEQRRAA